MYLVFCIIPIFVARAQVIAVEIHQNGIYIQQRRLKYSSVDTYGPLHNKPHPTINK